MRGRVVNSLPDIVFVLLGRERGRSNCPLAQSCSVLMKKQNDRILRHIRNLHAIPRQFFAI